MKKAIITLLTIIALTSCKEKKVYISKEWTPKGIYPGIYKKNNRISYSDINMLTRDTIAKNGEVNSDTALLYLGLAPRKTPTGKDTSVIDWIYISKDSVRIAGTLTVDSLAKTLIR